MDLCECCKKNEATEPHRCPYEVEINKEYDEDFFCTCCLECEDKCADAV